MSYHRAQCDVITEIACEETSAGRDVMHAKLKPSASEGQALGENDYAHSQQLLNRHAKNF